MKVDKHAVGGLGGMIWRKKGTVAMYINFSGIRMVFVSCHLAGWFSISGLCFPLSSVSLVFLKLTQSYQYITIMLQVSDISMDILDNPDNENMIVEDFCGDSDARPYSFSYSDTKINTDWNII